MPFASVYSSFGSSTPSLTINKQQQQQQYDREATLSIISIMTGSHQEAVLLDEHLSSWGSTHTRAADNGTLQQQQQHEQPPTPEQAQSDMNCDATTTTATSTINLWNLPLPEPLTVEGVVLSACKEISLTSHHPSLDSAAAATDNNALPPLTTCNDTNTNNTCITLYRNGYGVRTVRAPFGYNLHVYVATLYTDRPIQSEREVHDILLWGNEHDGAADTNTKTASATTTSPPPPQVFVMEFTFLRHITPSQMSIAWNYQLDNSVTTKDYEKYDEDRATFLKLLGDGPMHEGGTMIFEFRRSSSSSSSSTCMSITNQGQKVGEISGDGFQRAFASMWFGEKPVMQEIKAGLLQGVGRGAGVGVLEVVNNTQQQQQPLIDSSVTTTRPQEPAVTV